MQSLLQGLPLAAQSYTYQQPSMLSELQGTAGGIGALYKSLFGGNTSTSPTAANSDILTNAQLQSVDAGDVE